MKLLEFIAYCKLSGLIRRTYEINDGTYKVTIDRGDVRVDMLYNTDGDGAVIKSELTVGANFWYHPELSTIVEAFFPNEFT